MNLLQQYKVLLKACALIIHVAPPPLTNKLYSDLLPSPSPSLSQAWLLRAQKLSTRLLPSGRSVLTHQLFPLVL